MCCRWPVIIWLACRCRRMRWSRSVSAALSQVIMHLLEKDPDRRYQSG